MKNNEIIEMAAKIAEKFKDDDFFIGSKVDEVLPNGKVSTLICVDCSWLKRIGEKPILEVDGLDAIEESVVQTTDSIEIKRELDELTFTKWVDMIDVDGDVHHCKVESYVELSIDVFHPVEDTGDWVVYVEV